MIEKNFNPILHKSGEGWGFPALFSRLLPRALAMLARALARQSLFKLPDLLFKVAGHKEDVLRS